MMAYPDWLNWRSVALGVGAAALILLIGAVLFVWSGIYNVAASRGHFAITESIFGVTLRRSVEMRSLGKAVPLLDDGDLIRLGAGHFAGGCAPCHGAPGQPKNPIVQSMLPSPPALSEAVESWSPEELFWIVKNGLKYTGMPAWPARERDDEVWAVVAFLMQLPEMAPRDYLDLVSGAERSAWGFGGSQSSPASETCARCHDSRDADSRSRLAPRLAGQHEAYLRRALQEYARGERRSGLMQPVASDLDQSDIENLAEYYSGLESGSGSPAPAPDREIVVRGSRIARDGIPARGIPSCLACHSGSASKTFPLLAGQSGDYLAGQLRLWQRGLRDQTAHGAIMSAIARRLTEEDIADVAAYFEEASPAGIARGAEAAAGGGRP